MKIIKRSGSENEFDADKIVAAISKANTEVPTIERLSEEQICEIASNVEKICLSVELDFLTSALL